MTAGDGSAPGPGTARPGGVPDGPVLGLDASVPEAGAALLAADGTELGAWRQAPGLRGTAPLAAAVGRLLEQAGLTVADLAGVAVGTGPGSYTGLRAGIALARGLVFASGAPLAGVPSTEAAALAVLTVDAGAESVTVLIDARRGETYRADYRRGPAASADATPPTPAGPTAAASLRVLAPPRLVPVAEVEGPDGIVPAPGGEDVASDRRRVVREPVPDAYDVARLGRTRLLAGGDDPATVLPLYLKRSHAEIALEERQRR